MSEAVALLTLSALGDARVEERVQAIARAATALPMLVTQRTVERWTGLPGRDFLAAARAGSFSVSKVKRLVFARTADVIAWIESHRGARAENDGGDEWAASLAAVGARRIGGSR